MRLKVNVCVIKNGIHNNWLNSLVFEKERVHELLVDSSLPEFLDNFLQITSGE